MSMINNIIPVSMALRLKPQHELILNCVCSHVQNKLQYLQSISIFGTQDSFNSLFFHWIIRCKFSSIVQKFGCFTMTNCWMWFVERISLGRYTKHLNRFFIMFCCREPAELERGDLESKPVPSKPVPSNYLLLLLTTPSPFKFSDLPPSLC